MQQTDQYQLNLIEKDDTFSPDPLNENARRLEEALQAAREAGDAEAAAREELAQRVAALEVHKIAAGSYTAGSSPQTINVGFYPRAAIVHGGSGGTFLATRSASGSDGTISLTGNGFVVTGSANRSGTYAYLALC